MKLSKGFALLTAFFATSCFTKITIKSPDLEKSGLIESAVHILKSCYGNRLTTVGLAGNSTGTISETMWYQKSRAVALINAFARPVENGVIHPQSRYKLHAFVVSVSSPSILAKTLREIKASIWWNHMADFLILDRSPSVRSCSNAFEILWAAWEMNALNAKLMCHHLTRGRLIYTYNPYTSNAPAAWQLEKIYNGTNNHPWSMFVREYEEDEGVCDELDFEKTNDLGGYVIRVSVTSFGHDRIDSNRVCFGLFEDIVCEILFPALNATPKVLVHSSLNSIGYVDEKGNITGILGEVANGSSDLGVLGRFLTSLKNLTTTYPHYQSQLRTLTQYSGYESQLSKIRSVIDGNSRSCLYLACLITVLFFKYLMRESTIVALLSTLRIICNASIPKIPAELAPRFYLGGLFLFALTMQGIYQGKLASLLTKQKPLRNVNTMKDLAELGHTIYGSTTYRSYFAVPELEDRYVDIKGVMCTDYVLRNPGAACVGNEIVLIYDAAKLKLHVSRNAMALLYTALPIRPDWPLERRVNTLLVRSFEANRIQYLIDNVTYETYRLIEIQENGYKVKGAKILTLEQLNFTFAILGIGLGCATIIFLIELGIDRTLLRFRDALISSFH